MKPNERLKKARANAGYTSPTEVSDAFRDINKNTYISHENGNRAISKKAAARYAEAFQVDPGWLLYGVNSGESSSVKIRGEQQILAMLKRIEGLNDQDVSIALSVILNAIRVNASSQSPSQQHDQLVPATPPHGSKPSSQR